MMNLQNRTAAAALTVCLSLIWCCSEARGLEKPDDNRVPKLSGQTNAALTFVGLPPDSSLTIAGVRPGDRLVGWRYANGDEGAFTKVNRVQTIAEWQRLSLDWSERARVSLSLLRDGESLFVGLSEGEFAADVVPTDTSVETGLLYRLGTLAVETPSQENVSALMSLAHEKSLRDKPQTQCWILWFAARLHLRERRWEHALTSLSDAQDASCGDSANLFLRLEQVKALLGLRQFEEARLTIATARSTVDSLWHDSLIAAEVRRHQATVDFYEGRRDEYRRATEEALILATKVAPQSLLAAKLLNNLAHAERSRDAAAAVSFLARALDIVRERAPNSQLAGILWGTLGNIERERGRLEEAQEAFDRELSIKQSSGERGAALATAFDHQGAIAGERRQLDRAEQYLRMALELKRNLGVSPRSEAATLDNLATVAFFRGEFDVARYYDEQALSIRERNQLGDQDLAFSLHNLGTLALEEKNLTEASSYLNQAYSLRYKTEPESLETARTLNQLGLVFWKSGDLVNAETRFVESLGIAERHAPDRLNVARPLQNLGHLRLEQGKPILARELFTEMLAVASRLAPGSLLEADAHYGLGLCARATGEYDSASRSFEQALVAVEEQSERLGGDGLTLAKFRSLFHGLAYDYARTLVQLERVEDAFTILERTRGRAFLTDLSLRSLGPAGSLAPGSSTYDELQRLNRKNDRLINSLSKPDQEWSAGESTDALRAQLAGVKDRQRALVVRLRSENPRFAELRYPQPLTYQQAVKAIPEGTLILAYMVGEESSLLFEADATGLLRAHTLSAGNDVLAKQILRFRMLIESTSSSKRRSEEMRRHASHLFQLLIEPAWDSIVGAKRVLLLTDSSLNRLPFAALGRWTEKDAKTRWQFLAEVVPLHNAVSLSVLRELYGRPLSGSDLLTAFAASLPRDDTNADSSSSSSDDTPVLRTALWQRSSLPPLPNSEAEVHQIEKLHRGRSQLFVGSEATEVRARSIPPSRYVHFACHAVVDDLAPLDSALVLASTGSPDNGANGFLQAWEIVRDVRLDADLVVLSACNSGLGKEVAGEGLLGLTRAFHHSGARSVLASLWRVGDQTTSLFMTAFYRELNENRSPGSALNNTQIRWIGRGESPATWAAFGLSGPFE